MTQQNEKIVELFRAAGMPPGLFYSAGEIPEGRLTDVMAYLTGTGVDRKDILGVYIAECFDRSISGYVLTENALYNIGGFMQHSLTEKGCVTLPFNKISKIVILNKYTVGDGSNMDDEFWNLHIYADGAKTAGLYYRKPSPNRKFIEKKRFPLRLREFAVALNEMVKAAQGRPVIELQLDNPSDAERIPIAEQDRTVVATSAVKLLLRFLLLSVSGAVLSQIFIFWMLWGHDLSTCFWPLLTMFFAFGLLLFAGSSFVSLLKRCGKFPGMAARIVCILVMAALCALPAYLTRNHLGFTGRYAADGISAADKTTGGMIQLHAGSFIQGLDSEAKVYSTFMTPSHRVTLSRDFSICNHEVTQGEFKALMGSLPKEVTGYYGKGSSYPVYGVSWYAAVAYCNKRSLAEGLEPCYSISGVNWEKLKYKDIPIKPDSDWDAVLCDFTRNGYRLPTEAEWEYAARAGDSTDNAYCWSGTCSADSLDNYAWYEDSSSGKSHSVKTRKPNDYGLYDMSGNVWEWCWDWWDAKLYEKTADGAFDPTGAPHGDSRVCRSGGWETGSGSCTVCSRFGEKPHFSGRKSGSDFRQPMGLRVVRTTQE